MWFQDVSGCFEMFWDRKSGRPLYKMIHATKMTPVNLWYELQMFGNPCHWEPEAESGLSGFRMFQDVSKCFGIGNLGHYEMTRATKMSPMNLSHELQLFGNPFHIEPEAESGLSGFRMFQDVSRWEIWATMEWHAPPKWPWWTCDTSHKCLGTHFIEYPGLKVVWFQDVSRCFGMGHYEMTRATKMTPMNLWYKVQMLGNPFHREVL